MHRRQRRTAAGRGGRRSPSGPGSVMAFGAAELVRLAERADAVVELVPQVGDSVAAGDPLFRVFGGPGPVSAGRPAGVRRHRAGADAGAGPAVRRSASWWTSPARPCRRRSTTRPRPSWPSTRSNTCSSCLGRRHLDEGRVRDRAGKLRVVYGTPDWPDFVMLAVSEVRQYGAGEHPGRPPAAGDARAPDATCCPRPAGRRSATELALLGSRRRAGVPGRGGPPAGRGGGLPGGRRVGFVTAG